MAAHWVVFAVALCILGGGYGAPCEPCDVTQAIEKAPGTVVPYVVDAIEEVLSPSAPTLVVAPQVATAPILQGLVAPYLPSLVATPCAPCAPLAINPPCDADGKPVALPSPLSFAIPTPPPLPASSIFSVLSQAQNGDPSDVLAQVTKLLASTLPCPHLQAAAAASPPPQAPCDAPSATANAKKAPPIVSTPTIQTPVSYLPPPPTILAPTPKVELAPKSLPVEPAAAGCGQPLDPALLAALQQQANLGVVSLPADILAQLNLSAALPAAEAPATVEAVAPSFEFPKFGQATSQLLNPWHRLYEPLRRVYTPHIY